MTFHYLTSESPEYWNHIIFKTFCCGTFPFVGPKTAVLCGKQDSVRSRHSARPLHAARRPAVQHQAALLPPMPPFAPRTRSRFTHFPATDKFCFVSSIEWSEVCVAFALSLKPVTSNKWHVHVDVYLTPYNKELQWVFFLLFTGVRVHLLYHRNTKHVLLLQAYTAN